MVSSISKDLGWCQDADEDYEDNRDEDYEDDDEDDEDDKGDNNTNDTSNTGANSNDQTNNNRANTTSNTEANSNNSNNNNNNNNNNNRANRTSNAEANSYNPANNNNNGGARTKTYPVQLSILRNRIPVEIKENPKKLAAMFANLKQEAKIRELRVLPSGDLRVTGESPHDYSILRQEWPIDDTYGKVSPIFFLKRNV